MGYIWCSTKVLAALPAQLDTTLIATITVNSATTHAPSATKIRTSVIPACQLQGFLMFPSKDSASKIVLKELSLILHF